MYFLTNFNAPVIKNNKITDPMNVCVFVLESQVWEESKLIIYTVSVERLRTVVQNPSQGFGFSNYEETNVLAWCVPL